MILIETTKCLDLVTLIVSGHLQAKDLPELKRVMESYGQPVVLNMKDVRLVDRDALRFLENFEAHNGQITSCPSYIREWIRRERAER